VRRLRSGSRVDHTGSCFDTWWVTDFRSFEYDRWELAAAAYAASIAPITVQVAEPMITAIGIGPGDRVLDVACGPADLTAVAAERGATAVGIDFSPNVVATARDRHPHLDIRAGDAESLDFPDRSFDAVLMAFLLGHLASPEAALMEARRVLTVGGRLAVSWWGAVDRAPVFSSLLKALGALGTNVAMPPALPFFHFSQPSAMHSVLVDAGFSDVVVTEVEVSWFIGSAATLVDTFRLGSARTGALLEAQTPATLDRIKVAVASDLAHFQTQQGLVVPTAVLIGSGEVVE